MIISGSSDGTVKFWNQSQEEVSSVSHATIDVLDRIWSVVADSVNRKFAVGFSGHNLIPPLKIFDLECCSESVSVTHPWNRGARVFDMSWEDPNTLLTCGYDTYVRKWDMRWEWLRVFPVAIANSVSSNRKSLRTLSKVNIRTGTCVGSWSDPMDAVLYSLRTDYRYTIVKGTQYNCKAVLWDQRMTNYVPVKSSTVFSEKFQKRHHRVLCHLQCAQRLTTICFSLSSPLHSVSFESSRFYGTTDRRLIELTFTGLENHEHNYRDILCYKMPKFGSVHVIL